MTTRVIAVDAMGGDFAPDVVVEGVLRVAKSQGFAIHLFGPENELVAKLNAIDSSWKRLPISIVDAPEVIAMGEEPVSVVQKKKESSLFKAVLAVKKGDCRAVVSAGNSGAMLVASILLLGRNKGIDRPALVGLLPGIKKPVVCLDLGANADCKVNNLYQFAHLGSRYMTDMYGIDRPLVGLLSNGEEKGKGSLLSKEAFAFIEESELNFFGNVEPGHILGNKVDVVVSDGFSGNVLLKTYEATAKMAVNFFEQELKKDAIYKKEIIDNMRTRLFIDKQGGALLLGVKKTAIVVHGDASAGNIERAIMFADRVCEKITMERFGIL